MLMAYWPTAAARSRTSRPTPPPRSDRSSGGSTLTWTVASTVCGPAGQGATPKLKADLAPALRQRVIDGPAKQGLDRANWTHPELAEHLHRAHGVRTSRSAVQRLCANLGIRPYRPTYRWPSSRRPGRDWPS